MNFGVKEIVAVCSATDYLGDLDNIYFYIIIKIWYFPLSAWARLCCSK